jgi:hypothetical protein
MILVGGVVLAIFYANPPEPIVISSRAELMRALTRPATPYETASPWIKLAGFALVGVGLALKLVARTRKSLPE